MPAKKPEIRRKITLPDGGKALVVLPVRRIDVPLKVTVTFFYYKNLSHLREMVRTVAETFRETKGHQPDGTKWKVKSVITPAISTKLKKEEDYDGL